MFAALVSRLHAAELKRWKGNAVAQGRMDSLDPENFKYRMTAREIV